ncbi:MAG: leucine-rich repeat domain-containing protein, partial [Solobacterium sp.]|nr:leucine-rich repeat domain-containing protein [Solobacterium sp.]
FLSNTSVESTNCRREINFALSRNKDFLSVALEPVQMSPGMEMQISSYQSLLSYKYPKWEDFEEKLLSLDILQSCRNVIVHEVEEPEIPEEVFKEEPVKSEPVQEIEQEKKPTIRPVPKKKEPKPETAKKPLTFMKTALKIVLGIFAALVLLMAVILFRPFEKTVKIDGKTIKNDSYISIKDAELSAKEVSDLAKLNKCTSLTLNNCKFESGAFSQISAGKQLQSLYLTGCTGIDSLTGLNDLEKLYTLEIENCGITDDLMNGVSLPVSLRNLRLPSNQLTYVPKADKLTTLEMPYNNISSIDNLAAMTALREVNLSGNQITNIDALSGHTSLTQLNLNDNQIGSIEPLLECVYLQKLYLRGNDIADLSPLQYCSELNTLNLNGNTSISDLSPLAKCAAKMQTLSLSSIIPDDLSLLSQMSAMRGLYLNRCGLQDLSFAANMPKLEVLNAAGNEISDISAISKCTKLEYINLASNHITSVSALSKHTEDSPFSRYLLLHNNQIASVDDLDPGFHYTFLSLTGNPMENAYGLKSLKGSNLFVDMIPGYQPAWLNSFGDVYVPEKNLDLQVKWEEHLGSSLKYSPLEEALKEELSKDSYGYLIVLP